MSLNEQNQLAVTVIQALWGAVTPNFRMVAICPTKPSWHIRFVLETADSEDLEEIDDVTGELEALLPVDANDYESDVEVTSGYLAWPDHPWLVIYRRKESVDSLARLPA
jgi:hypothetical protein